jgi:hypothetical protein
VVGAGVYAIQYTLSLDRVQMDPSPDVPSIAAKLDWALDQWLASVPGHRESILSSEKIERRKVCLYVAFAT